MKDPSPVLKGFKAAGADCFIGLTYPPDNMLVTAQAKEVDWNPAVFITGPITAFPFYRDRFKGAEGVTGIAGWNPKVKFPGARESTTPTSRSTRRSRTGGRAPSPTPR